MASSDAFSEDILPDFDTSGVEFETHAARFDVSPLAPWLNQPAATVEGPLPESFGGTLGAAPVRLAACAGGVSPKASEEREYEDDDENEENDGDDNVEKFAGTALDCGGASLI